MCPTPAGVGASGHSPIGAGGAGGGGENAYGNPEGDSNPYNPPPEGSAGSGSADGSPPNPQTLSRVEKEILVERGELVTRYFKYSKQTGLGWHFHNIQSMMNGQTKSKKVVAIL